jgi:hypothetical protein
MALVNYTGSITLRQVKGSALTFTELDTNFTYLNTGSTAGTYTPFDTIKPLLAGNGDGLGNVIEGLVAPGLSSGITASQLVTLDIGIPPYNTLYFTTASLSNSGSFIGVALETKSSNQTIKILTEGYYSVFSSGSIVTPGYFKDNLSVAGSPVFFSGSYVTSTKPATAASTRPLGFCFNTEFADPNQLKYIKFSPSSFTLG